MLLFVDRARVKSIGKFPELNLYKFLITNNIVRVKLSNDFKRILQQKLLEKYGSIAKYSRLKGISRHNTRLSLKKYQYFNLPFLIDIAKDLKIPKEDIYREIRIFFAKGSNTKKEIPIPMKLTVDEFFVEGFALYLAEGDQGSNGNTKPRKVRFTNSNLQVHKQFITWLERYFPNNKIGLIIAIPLPKKLTKEKTDLIRQVVGLTVEIRTQKCNWKRRTGWIYRTRLDSAIIIDIILAIENSVKQLCSLDRKLSCAYIRGMMIGEGTAYFNKSRYVRIEMKNKKEIFYLHELFLKLGFSGKPSLRTNREHMWSIYIGAKQLKKYNDLIGFGVHEERQEILNRAVNKKLRVNQYC